MSLNRVGKLNRTNPIKFWYVIRSKPQKEEFLYNQLLARGQEAFYPHLRVKPINPRCRTLRPYFPGYLFVSADLQLEGFSAFQWLPGSLGLVSFGGAPSAVPAEMIRSIQRTTELANAGFGSKPVFSSGDEVTIREGVFDGYLAIFDTHMPADDRVRVLLQYLRGRQVPLVLPINQIEALQVP